MASIPKKVGERLIAGLKRYQPVLTAAGGRGVGEGAEVRRKTSRAASKALRAISTRKESAKSQSQAAGTTQEVQ